jgi:N-acetylneuraminate synthase
VKFQLTRIRHLQPSDRQYAWFQKAEFSLEQFRELKQHCEDRGKQFLVTVYHADDMAEVRELGCQRVKIGSGEAGNVALAQAVGPQSSTPMVPLVSCGIFRQSFHLWPNGIFLACESRYPSPRGIAPVCFLRGSYYTGWSDHSIGIEECQSAISLGAQIIECHVKLPHQKRPSQSWEKSCHEIQALRRYADYDAESLYAERWQAG